MKNIVLDTNCLLASLSRNQEEYIIWKSLQEGRFNLCVTNEILDEYVEVLQRNISPTIAENVMFLMLNLDNLIFVDTYFKFNLITADPDDNKFVDCAITAGATYIVSNDRHFDELQKYDFPKVAVRTLAEFMAIVKELFK